MNKEQKRIIKNAIEDWKRCVNRKEAELKQLNKRRKALESSIGKSKIKLLKGG